MEKVGLVTLSLPLEVNRGLDFLSFEPVWVVVREPRPFEPIEPL